jgi:Domain of unknown function (DUF4349)
MTAKIDSQWLLIAASALALGACAQSPDGSSSVNAPQLASSQLNQSPGQSNQSPAGRRVAVTHAFSLRLPSNDVEAVQQRHLAECRKLGCTVLNTQLDRSNEGRVNARCSIRIAPDAYQAFAAIIRAAPAEVITQSESADDRTAPMLDVEKRLEVKSALRDRLTAMLRDPGPKSISDLVAVEKELAQVQGDIESATAQRDQLKTITETVRVDIAYSGRAAVVAGIDFSPVRQAVNGAGRTAVSSLATLISFLAAIVSWLPLIALLVWGLRAGLRRWKAPKAPAQLSSSS